MITYKTTISIFKEDLLALYNDAGWSSYTTDIDKLQRAIENSYSVFSAWENDILVGLVRSISDGETICYIQDILVLEAYKRKGIGKALIDKILVQCNDIRQIVLLTDAQDFDTRKFYESQSFKSCDDGFLVAFTKVD